MRAKTIITAVILLFSVLSFGQTIAKDYMSKDDGETRTKASYHLFKENGVLKLNAKIDVRKSGMSGNGKGAFAIAIFNKDNELIYEIKKGLTVGAKFPQGVNSKDWNQNLTITGEQAEKMQKEGVIIAFNANTIYDDKGMLNSLNDFKQSLKEALEFTSDISDLAVGQSLTKGDWKITKLLP